jgi:hypothetical protein
MASVDSVPDSSADLEAWVICTRLVQGHPAHVEDPVVPARIIDLLCPSPVADYQSNEAEEA